MVSTTETDIFSYNYEKFMGLLLVTLDEDGFTG